MEILRIDLAALGWNNRICFYFSQADFARVISKVYFFKKIFNINSCQMPIIFFTPWEIFKFSTQTILFQNFRFTEEEFRPNRGWTSIEAKKQWWLFFWEKASLHIYRSAFGDAFFQYRCGGRLSTKFRLGRRLPIVEAFSRPLGNPAAIRAVGAAIAPIQYWWLFPGHFELSGRMDSWQAMREGLDRKEHLLEWRRAQWHKQLSWFLAAFSCSQLGRSDSGEMTSFKHSFG